jgi:hypothetical protein
MNKSPPDSDFQKVEPPNVLAAALDYAGRGWYVFPSEIVGKTKKSRKSAEHSNGVKWGMTKHPDEIRADYKRWPEAGVGIPTGKVNGFFVVETDTMKGHDVEGIKALRELEALHGELPQTLMAESPSGSLHYYFKHPGGELKVWSSTSMLAKGVDVKGDGGMVIAPPTVRIDGQYMWVNDLEIADPPQWLLEKVSRSRTRYCAKWAGGESRDAPKGMIAAAMKVIPNDGDWAACFENYTDWTGYNNIMMALFDATEGSEDGYQIAFEWCKKNAEKFEVKETVSEMWYERIAGCPPNQLHVGTIFALANFYQPGFTADWNRQHEGDGTLVVDPVDLWGKFDPPPLPSGLLPEAIEAFAREQGCLMGCDPAGLAMSALAVCAAAIPDSIKLKPKRHEPWMVAARIWVGLVGDPSSMKTPMMRAATGPLERLDIQMWRAYIEAQTRYDAMSKEEKRTAPKPKQTRLRIEDTTIEAAQEILKDSPDGVLCFRDEISTWFGGMDKYHGSRGADRGFWLQTYNGGSFAYNRVSRGSGLIENLSVSILGGIQPGPMREIAEQSVDDGLMQRLIVIMVRPAEMGRDEPMSDAAERYSYLIPRLRELEPPFDDLTFDDGAMAVRSRLEQRHLDLMKCESINKKLAEHIGKYNGVFARLCVIWHCVEHAGEELPTLVSEQTAQKVSEFMHRFLLPHALAFYTGVLGLSDDHERLTAVAGYILARRLEWITNRDVQRGDRTMRKIDRWDIDSVFNQLDALGWLYRVSGTRPTDPPRWKVNPEVHLRFAERAEREAVRRQRDRDMIAELIGQRRGEP